MAYNRAKVVRGFHILLALITSLIICSEMIYTISSRKRVEKYARYSVKQNSEEISKEIDVYIESALNSMRLASQFAKHEIEENGRDDIIRIAGSLDEFTPFIYVEYTDSEGIRHTDRGEDYYAGEYEYFKDGLSGNTGIYVDYSPEYADEVLIEFYTPLYYQNDVTGVLTGTIGSNTNILPLLITTFYGERMTGVLCDSGGQIISSTVETEDDLYLEDILSDLKVSSQEKDNFSKHFEEMDNNVFRYSTQNGKAIASIVSNEKTGWKVIQIVPPSSFRSVIIANTLPGYITAAVISAFLIIYLLHVVFDARLERKAIIQEKDMVVHNYEQILTTTASDTYKSIRTLNLESSDMDYIYFENGHVKKVVTGRWETWLEDQKKNIHPDDFEKVREIFSLDYLRFLGEGDTCRENYRSSRRNKEGFYRYYTTTVSITNMDNKKTAILTTIENTEAVINEIEQKRILASAASIYVSMHALDLKNNTFTALNSPSYISDIIENRKTDIQSVLNDVMNRLTDEEYLASMMEFINFSTLDERMKDTNTITFEFIGKKSGWCRARFIAAEYDDVSRKLNRVLWVVENIDAEKRKANQLLYLSETDLMTGIRNRGSGERRIKELIASGQQGMFCLLDADKFKSINDNYGHGAGDKVLISIAECLKDSFRESDVVMRLGGDEFAIFAVGVTEKEAAASLIERFFDRIENISIPELGDRKISVSLGAAIRYARDAWDFDTLYRNADSCTYISKKITGCAYTFYGENNN